MHVSAIKKYDDQPTTRSQETDTKRMETKDLGCGKTKHKRSNNEPKSDKISLEFLLEIDHLALSLHLIIYLIQI